MVIEDMKLETPKTKEFIDILKVLNINGKKTCFIIPDYNDNVYRSLRNVPSVCGTLLSDINTYDIVNANVLVFTESAAKIFVEDNKEEENKEVAKA